MKPKWPQVRCQKCDMVAHWRDMVMKQEAVHPDSKGVKWHLCGKCEALETGQTEAQVMEATIKKQTEHHKHRVQRYHALLRRNKKKLLRSIHEEMFPEGKAPAMVAKDGKAYNALVQKLKESSSLQEEQGHSLVKVDDKSIAYDSQGIPASSYPDMWVSSKDRTCSCNGSLQILAACCTCCVLRV